MRPGTNVTTSTAIPPATPPTNTGTWFVVGSPTQGPTAPTLITSFAQYQKIYGERGTIAQIISDSIETFFLEGGSRVYVARAQGAAAVSATVVLKDSGATETLKVTADGPGTYANGFKIIVTTVAGESYTITVQNSAAETLEISPVLNSREEAVAWSKKTSLYVTIALAGASTKSPNAATSILASGTDVAAAASDIATGLKSFLPEHGPGQISVPGNTTQAVVEELFAVAEAGNRRAVGDLKLGASKAELITEAGWIKGNKARCGALYASWQQVAPLPNTGAPRTVPPSAFVAAKCAVIDALGNPNLPVAGKQAVLFNSLGQETAFSEKEIEELYGFGVNVTKVVNGQVRIYGTRTPASPTTDALYVQFNNCRLDMAIIWKGLAIEENFLFTQLDGEGDDTSQYEAALKGMMLGLYRVGAVFGTTPQEAYTVDAGTTINTLQSESEGTLNATIAARRSPGADQVNLNIVRVSITQEV